MALNLRMRFLSARNVNIMHNKIKIGQIFLVIIGLVVFFALLYWIWWTVAPEDRSISRNAAIPGLSLTFFVAIFALVVMTVSSRFSIADIIVGYFVAISFSFVGLYEEAARRFIWPIVHGDADGLKAAIITLVFFVSYLVGTSSYRRKSGDRCVVIGNSRSKRAAETMLVFSILIIIYLGPDEVIRPRQSDFVDLGSYGAQLLLLAKSLALTSFLYFELAYIKNYAVKGSRMGLWLLGAAIPVVLFFNPITNARFQFIAVTFAILTIALGLWRMSPRAKVVILVALTAGNFLLLGPLKFLSEGVGAADISFYSDVSESMREYAYRVDFDSYQVSANAMAYFSQNELLSGSNIISAALFFIPRSIWPNKAEGTSYIVHRFFGYPYQNLSFPLPFELYGAGGVVFLMISSFLFGRFLRGLSWRSVVNEETGRFGASNIMLALVAGYMPIILRGALNSVVPLFGFSLVAVGILVLAARLSLRSSPVTQIKQASRR